MDFIKRDKLYPLIIFIMVFTLTLSGQISCDILSNTERLKKTDKNLSEINFLVKDMKGKEYQLEKISAPIIILNFWASWCRPCLEEMPSLVELRKKYPKDKILILGINNDEENQVKMIKKINKKYKINFPMIMDKNYELARQFKVSALPVTIIYRNKKIIQINRGATDFSSGEFLELISHH